MLILLICENKYLDYYGLGWTDLTLENTIFFAKKIEENNLNL